MPNSAISFNTSGLATDTSPGLVGTGAQTFAGKKTLDGGALIKGDTSGVAIATGYVGQATAVSTASNVNWGSSGVTTDVVSLSLTSGIWLVFANVTANFGTAFSVATGSNAGNANNILASLSTVSNGYNGTYATHATGSAFASTGFYGAVSLIPTVFNLSSSQNIYANLTLYFDSQTGGKMGGKIYAIRIA